MAERGVKLRHPPGRGWVIGSNVYVGRGAILDIWPGATLALGARTKVMHYVVVAARESVTVGSHTQISEFSTVRDADHGIDTDGLISESPMLSSPITIGDNTWVGRGCGIIRGAHLGDGVVVAANSVVRTAFPSDVVIAGTPAVVKKPRPTGQTGVTA